MKYKITNREIELDVKGLECPIPVLKARKLAQKTKNGDRIKVLCTEPLAEIDFKHYCEQVGYKYIKCSKNKNEIIIFYQIIKN